MKKRNKAENTISSLANEANECHNGEEIPHGHMASIVPM